MIARTFRTTVVALLAVTAMALTACAPLKVKSFLARDGGPMSFRTYAWAADGERATGDPRLDSNPFFEQRLIADVDRELKARGFERVESGTAELTLHYHASVTQRLDITTVDRAYGYCDGCKSGYIYDAGTILLDLVNTKTKKLVWRAWAEGVLGNIVDNQQWLEERIDESVVKIAATLPSRS